MTRPAHRPRDLHAILRGGYCTRWHANPDMAHIRETLAGHHGRVAQIVFALHPAPSINLVDAAVHHDCGEPGVGDLPYDFKRKFPVIARQHAAAEAEAMAALGLEYDLTVDERLWLKLADRLAARQHVAHVAAHLLAGDGWPEETGDILATADRLGVLGMVEALVGERLC